MKREAMLFLFEPSSMEAFISGSNSPVYSHDMNLMQIAQAALNLGCEVYIANFHDSTKIYSTDSMWPIVNLNSSGVFSTIEKKLTFTFSANHIAFRNRNRNRNRNRSRNRNVLIQAAIHPVENPSMYYPAGISLFINVVRNQIDFFVTQNNRMKNLLFSLLMLLTGFQQSERILTSKLVPKRIQQNNHLHNRNKFREYNSIGSEDILFVNAGGAWSWTLFHEFIEAFAKVVTDYPEMKFFFFQPALGQSSNESHAEYNQKTLKILSKLSEAERSRILLGSGWDTEGDFLKSMLDAADYGISFSRESLEHWQSYRVRILEYLAHNVPVITSTGSFWDDEKTGKGFIFIGHRESDLYNGIVQVIQSHTPEILKQRRADLQILLDDLTLEKQAEVLVKQLTGHPLRDQKPKIDVSPIWDYREFGALRGISARRIYKTIYYRAVNNVYMHSFLVLIGARRIIRYLRKIR